MLRLKLYRSHLRLVEGFCTTLACMLKDNVIRFRADYIPRVISSSAGGNEIGD